MPPSSRDDYEAQRRAEREAEEARVKRFIKLGVASAAGVLLLALVLGCFFTVGQNEQAVVSRWGKFDYVADPGLHWKLPIIQGSTHYRTDVQQFSSARVNTYTVDNQEVDVTYTVFYRVPADKVGYLFENNRDYLARLQDLATDRMKAAMGQVNVQSVAEKRGELRDRIKATLAHDAAPMGVLVTDFQLTDMQYTEAFRNAINQAAVQKAQIDSVEYQRQQAEKTAETAKITAHGQADAAREAAQGAADARVAQAKAEAEAIRVQGQANADAILAQAEALKANPQLVNLRTVEKWNGSLPALPPGWAPLPLMNLQSK